MPSPRDLSPRDLADRYFQSLLDTNPFAATSLGIPGHDAEVPDASEAADESRRAELQEMRGLVSAAARTDLGPDEHTTLACVAAHLDDELATLEMAAGEHTVTPMPFRGPAAFFALAARTTLADTRAAEDYVTRLRLAGGWIDQQTDRLRAGAAKGRVPVAPLVHQTIAWAEGLLSQRIPAAVTAPAPPSGWAGAARWLEQRDLAVTDHLRPAVERWVEQLRSLVPVSLPAARPGLLHLPGGVEEYRLAVRKSTTLDIEPEELHRIGMEEIERLEQRAVELGADLGFTDLASTRWALLGSAGAASPEDSIAAAVRAVRRAEARAGEVFPSPLPPPCSVEPMPPAVGAAGTAPHYSPPRLDGSRPGTYWFNTAVPTAGTGWDLEAVAFHEAVPGHHLQISRVQLLEHLPDLQRLVSITAFAEGWGLYAEQLAEEMGLYSDVTARLGAITAQLMRAARLVLDTGIHALGWSRNEALRFYVEHVPLPEEFLTAEIDRYIMWPGQALAYLTGKLHLLRLRDEAQQKLGHRFDLPGFHAAVLDHGSLPLPVLTETVARWVASFD